MRRFLIVVNVLFALVIPFLAPPRIGTAMQPRRDLAAVREATAKYHNVNAAIADGYVPTEQCVDGMG